MNRLILLLPLFLLGCSTSNSQDYEMVSLLDYTTQEELDSLGYTLDRVTEINELKKAEFGYNRYDGYRKHTLNNFDILVNPNNPDELYIVKNNRFLLGIKEPDTVTVYNKDTKFPNPSDMSIYFEYNTPSVFVANDKKIYYDLNLDGVDVVYKKDLYTGIREYINYVDLLPLPNYIDLIQANIPNQQCKALITEVACCITDKGSYQPYQFDYKVGWQINKENKKLYEYCNSADIENTKKELMQKLFSD